MDQRLREDGISVRGSSVESASPHAEERALAPREIPRDSSSRDDVTPKARPWIKSGTHQSKSSLSRIISVTHMRTTVKRAVVV